MTCAVPFQFPEICVNYHHITLLKCQPNAEQLVLHLNVIFFYIIMQSTCNIWSLSSLLIKVLLITRIYAMYEVVRYLFWLKIVGQYVYVKRMQWIILNAIVYSGYYKIVGMCPTCLLFTFHLFEIDTWSYYLVAQSYTQCHIKIRYIFF